MKFYKNSDDEWVLGNDIIPEGTCMKDYDDNGLLCIVNRFNGTVYAASLLPTQFEKQDGTKYANETEFKAATKDFFFKRTIKAHKVSVVSPTEENDSVEIGAEKGIELKGRATVHDDLTSDITRAKTIGTRVVFNDVENTVDFSATATVSDYVVLSYQLSHKWKIGSKLYPHIHWEQSLNATPNWLIQYRWQKQGGSKTTAWTNYVMTTNAFPYTSGTINQISHDSGLTPPVACGLSDIIEIRLIRDSVNATGLFPGANQYTGTVSVTSLDIHYEIDTMGSKDEYLK